MKIYTRTGDDGTTGLIGGARVGKDALRVETYGTIDELLAVLGVADASLRPADGDSGTCPAGVRLRAVMDDLFALNSHLAAPAGEMANLKLPPLPDPKRLELEIDAAEARLTPLSSFILPGGAELAARLHLARCVCRRAERLLVHLGRSEDIPAASVVYLNRLSDWLFVHARLANHVAGVPDVPWTPSASS